MATLWDECDAVLNRLNNAIPQVLDRDVAPVVIDRIITMSDPAVYDAYTPSLYERRYSLQEENSYTHRVGPLQLEITANIMSNPSQPGWGPYVPIEISDIITNGSYYGPRWSLSRIYNMQPFPRPWMEPGLQQSISDRSAEQALENGLLAMGF